MTSFTTILMPLAATLALILALWRLRQLLTQLRAASAIRSKVKDAIRDHASSAGKRQALRISLFPYAAKLPPTYIASLAHRNSWPAWVVTSLPILFYRDPLRSVVLAWREYVDLVPPHTGHYTIVRTLCNGEILYVSGDDKYIALLTLIATVLEPERNAHPYSSSRSLLGSILDSLSDALATRDISDEEREAILLARTRKLVDVHVLPRQANG